MARKKRKTKKEKVYAFIDSQNLNLGTTRTFIETGSWYIKVGNLILRNSEFI